MKTSTFRTLTLATLLTGPLLVAAGCDYDRADRSTHDSSRETSHSESDKKGWFGGHIHEVNTTYTNSDGSTSIETESTTTKNGTTTIVRERKTTFPDGHVKVDNETRTIVKGTDSSTHETKTTN